MIASATSNAAATAGAAAAFTPPDTAGGLDAFAALLDGLAAASQDAAAPPAALGGIPVGAEANIGLDARGRKGRLPVELPVDGTDASAESRAADQQAADAGLALLLASLTMAAPIRPSDVPEAATGPAAGRPGDLPVSAAVESQAPEANTPHVDIREFAAGKTPAASDSLPAATAAIETAAAENDRSADERDRAVALTPESARSASPAAPRPGADPDAAVRLADAAPAGATGEAAHDLTDAPPGRKPPVQHGLSAGAVDAPAAPPVSRDDKPVKSFGKGAAGEATQPVGAEAVPADAVTVASAPSNLSSGSGRDNSQASSSQSRIAVDASAAAPARAARSAQAFARAIEVHMAAVAAPATSHVQSSSALVQETAAAVPDDLSTQIVQAVRMQWSDGAGDARITLKPEYLGDVTIALHVDQGSVTAVLHADSPAVRSWLQANEPLLGQALSEQGLKLERLVVSEQPPTEDGGAPDDDTPRQQEEPRRRRQRPDAAGFEIIL